MSRERKFRGKTHYGKWTYGGTYDSFIVEDIKDTDNSSILFKVESTTLTMDRTIRVLEDTIGQYTGLEDCNGIEIYEGDFVKTIDGIMEIKYMKDSFQCVDCKGRNHRLLDYIYSEYIIVIGNKYENPELLENR